MEHCKLGKVEMEVTERIEKARTMWQILEVKGF